MNDWLHCNKCYMKYQPNMKMYLTECGHTFCGTCTERIQESKCHVCKKSINYVQLSKDMDANLQQFFTPSNVLHKKALEVYDFQMQHRMRLYQVIMKKYNYAKKECINCHNKLKTVMRENKMLKNMLMSAGRFGPAFQANTPSFQGSTPALTSDSSVDNSMHMMSSINFTPSVHRQSTPGYAMRMSSSVDKNMRGPYDYQSVILIFGTCGALRTSEIVKLEIDHVEDNGTIFIVTVEDNKNDYPRTFIIGKEYYNVVKQYIELRPKDCNYSRFFVNYQKGKCTNQVIGKNRISEVPKTVAIFLNLQHPERYTGHCFRRTAATLLANSGANVTSIKQLGGWRSSTVAEGYVENSLVNRAKIYEGIMAPAQPSTSKCANQPLVQKSDIVNDDIIPNTFDEDEHQPQLPEPPQNNLSISKFDKNYPKSKLSDNVNSGRLPLKELMNSNTIRAKKQKRTNIPVVHSDEIEVENKVTDSVTIHSPFVKFNNCEIKQIIINNINQENN